MEISLPELYKLDKNGIRRIWKCRVCGNTVYREYGIVGKKLASNKRSFEGNTKTTDDEQAKIEANKDWVSKIDEGYLPFETDTKGMEMLENIKKDKKEHGGHNINSVASLGVKEKKNIKRTKAETCMVDDSFLDAIIPMKAKEWELRDDTDPYSILPNIKKFFCITEGKGKNLKLIPTEFYGQPKLDGYRARVFPIKDKNKITVGMTTNSGKQYPWFSKLRTIFVDIFQILENHNIDVLSGFDGELWCRDFIQKDNSTIKSSERFSMIQSICNPSRSEPHELENQIQFHCFDLMDSSGNFTQENRFDILNKIFELIPSEHKKFLIKVETKILCDVSEVVEFRDKCISDGFEGSVFRTKNLKYVPGTRSNEMRKFKVMSDSEFLVIGCKLDKGVNIEHFVWILETENKLEFSAKPEGTKEEKLGFYKNKEKYIGKYLTIQFQEMSKDGIPRFPVAKAFRAGKGQD